jgi:hypothetical protein
MADGMLVPVHGTDVTLSDTGHKALCPVSLSRWLARRFANVMPPLLALQVEQAVSLPGLLKVVSRIHTEQLCIRLELRIVTVDVLRPREPVRAVPVLAPLFDIRHQTLGL